MDNKKIILLVIFISVFVASIMMSRSAREKEKNVTNNTVSNEVQEQNSIENQDTVNEQEETNTVQESENETTREVTENKIETPKAEIKGEEETKDIDEKEEDKSEKAIALVKEEWGEDDTVYFTLDNEDGSVFNISVRSKETTATVAEYEVDVSKGKVTMN